MKQWTRWDDYAWTLRKSLDVRSGQHNQYTHAVVNKPVRLSHALHCLPVHGVSRRFQWSGHPQSAIIVSRSPHLADCR